MKYLTLSLSLLAVLLLPWTAAAQTISITPMEWDFGGVQICDSEMAVFTMTSVIDDDLRVFAV